MRLRFLRVIYFECINAFCKVGRDGNDRARLTLVKLVLQRNHFHNNLGLMSCNEMNENMSFRPGASRPAGPATESQGTEFIPPAASVAVLPEMEWSRGSISTMNDVRRYVIAPRVREVSQWIQPYSCMAIGLTILRACGNLPRLKSQIKKLWKGTESNSKISRLYEIELASA